jgi:hypothetical protein
MGNPQEAQTMMKPAWLRYVLMALIVEKIVQHIAVSLAFYFDWGNIGSTVAVNSKVLMVSGALVAALFILSLWGMASRKRWAVNLVIGLALVDMLGEFIAQGRISIVITVSFIAATILFILGLIYRRQELRRASA